MSRMRLENGHAVRSGGLPRLVRPPSRHGAQATQFGPARRPDGITCPS